MKKNIKASVIGASGFTGRELVRMLAAHPEAEIDRLYSRTYSGMDINEVYPELKGTVSEKLAEPSPEMSVDSSDVVFLAMPHTRSARYAARITGTVDLVIDLSADYRFRDPDEYKKWYGVDHPDTGNLDKAVYGIPEINRDALKDTSLIANPGCYATSVVIALYPLVKENLICGPVYTDAKSGMSGAGRKVEEVYTFIRRNENITPYNVNSHRHMGEISEFLSSECGGAFGPLVFCPHLMPMDRGILSNMYTAVKDGVSEEDIRSVLEKYYGQERFVDIKRAGIFPEIKDVVNTNNLSLGFSFDAENNTLVVISAIDNLIKGASGQALQNMNCALGIPEETGLV